MGVLGDSQISPEDEPSWSQMLVRPTRGGGGGAACPLSPSLPSAGVCGAGGGRWGVRRAQPGPRAFPSSVRQGSALSPLHTQTHAGCAGPGNPRSGLWQNRAVFGKEDLQAGGDGGHQRSLPGPAAAIKPWVPQAQLWAGPWVPEPPAPCPQAPGAGPSPARTSAPTAEAGLGQSWPQPVPNHGEGSR